MLGRRSDGTENPQFAGKSRRAAHRRILAVRACAPARDGASARAPRRPSRGADAASVAEHDDRVRHARGRRRPGRRSGQRADGPVERARHGSSAVATLGRRAGAGAFASLERVASSDASDDADAAFARCGGAGGSRRGPVAAPRRANASARSIPRSGVAVLQHVLGERPDRRPVAAQRVDAVDPPAGVPVPDHALRACVDRARLRRKRRRQRRRDDGDARESSRDGHPWAMPHSRGSPKHRPGRRRRRSATRGRAGRRSGAPGRGGSGSRRRLPRGAAARAPEDQERDRDGRGPEVSTPGGHGVAPRLRGAVGPPGRSAVRRRRSTGRPARPVSVGAGPPVGPGSGLPCCA